MCITCSVRLCVCVYMCVCVCVLSVCVCVSVCVCLCLSVCVLYYRTLLNCFVLVSTVFLQGSVDVFILTLPAGR